MRIEFAKDIVPHLQQRGMPGQPGGELAQDAMDLFGFGMFEREDFIVQFDGFFGLDERGPPGVALSMEDAFDLAFVFGEDGDYPSAVEKGFFDIGYITRFGEPGEDAVEGAAQLVAAAEEAQANVRQFFTGVVPDHARFIEDFID